MIQHTRKLTSIVATAFLALACPDAFAGMGGGTISYSPYAHGIPTLSESMLVVLAFLFLVLAFRALRAYPGGKPLASLLAVGVLVLAAASGNYLVPYAQAVAYAFTNPGGGSFPVGTGEYKVMNISGIPQQVKSVAPNINSYAASTSGAPQCSKGLVVENSNSCYINFAIP